MRPRSAETAVWFGRSRLSSGSSRSSSSGLRRRAPARSATAAARRRSTRRSAASRKPSAPTSPITSSTRSRRLASACEREAPAVAVEAEPDEIDAADPGRGVEAVALRQVADVAVAPCRQARRGRSPSRPRAGAGRGARGGASTSRLRSGRARRRARPAAISRSTPLQTVWSPSLAAAPRSSTDRRSRLPSGRSVQCRRSGCSSSAACHCSKVRFAGESVSVIVATGIFSARASLLSWSISGVSFWLLKTHTLISRFCELALDGLPVGGADLASLGDRLGEARRREELQAEARSRAARRCSRCSRPARRRSGARISARSGCSRAKPLVSKALLGGEVAGVGGSTLDVGGDDRVDHSPHRRRRVPLVRVVALLRARARPRRRRRRGRRPGWRRGAARPSGRSRSRSRSRPSRRPSCGRPTRSARSRAGRSSGLTMMLVTFARFPASCAAMLPQKFSAATTWNLDEEPCGDGRRHSDDRRCENEDADELQPLPHAGKPTIE